MAQYYYYLLPGTCTFPFKLPWTVSPSFLKNPLQKQTLNMEPTSSCSPPLGPVPGAPTPTVPLLQVGAWQVCLQVSEDTEHVGMHVPGPVASPVAPKALGRWRETWVPRAELPVTDLAVCVGLGHLQ